MNGIAYIERDTILHRWHPRVKTLALLGSAFACAFFSSSVTLLCMFAVSLLLARLSRMSSRQYRRVLHAPVVMLLLLAPPLIISAGGEVLWSVGVVHIYTDGIVWTGMIALRSVTILTLFSVLVMTTPLHRMVGTLRACHVPASLVHIFISTYRFIFLFYDQLTEFRRAARLRGLSSARALIHIHTTVGMLVALLVRGTEQSERVGQAMRLRGFSGTYPAGPRRRLSPVDIWALLTTVVLVTGLMVVEMVYVS